jgi:3',5'-cyclic AMP phosphodiesterase CpdA
MQSGSSLRRVLSGLPAAALVALMFTLAALPAIPAESLPVKDPATAGLKAIQGQISNLIDIEQIYAAVKDGDDQGLRFDLSGLTTLLDGTPVDPDKIYGSIYVGPYPMEARHSDYDLKRFRRESALKHGKGRLALAYLLQAPHNSEGWTDAGVVALRVALALEMPGPDRKLGVYDTFVRFQKNGKVFTKRPAIIEGPLVHLVRSDDPGRLVISFKTGEEAAGKVVLEDGREFLGAGPTRRHEIAVTGLKPQKTYRYRVALDDYQTRWYTVRTAPPPGAAAVTFAYLGDSREGVGGGEQNFMGLNLEAVKYAMRFAYRQGADLVLMAGDLANGFTTSPEDFRTQLYAWKQAAAGFWHERPVYAIMGNHEALLKKFDDGSQAGLELDNWPYQEASSEAVFAREFINPANGPEPTDRRRPPYKRNVYAFQYGPVRFIAFNNTYWVNWQRDSWEGVKQYGGCPEGYVLPDQLDWIKRQVAQAENDPTVKYTILLAHEPLLPNGGHLQDCMWYQGDNRVRAYAVDGNGGPVAAGPGIIEMRNELIRLACRSKKVAAVLGSHEHAYHRTLVTKQVPLGDPAKDGANRDGRICADGGPCSPLPDLTHPTWFITSGGAGAPYYSEMPTPWNRYWRHRAGAARGSGYFYSSQENLVIFKAKGQKISMAVYNAAGQVVDRIDNLMAVKKLGK